MKNETFKLTNASHARLCIIPKAQTCLRRIFYQTTGNLIETANNLGFVELVSGNRQLKTAVQITTKR